MSVAMVDDPSRTDLRFCPPISGKKSESYKKSEVERRIEIHPERAKSRDLWSKVRLETTVRGP